jgi:hypothetical protein
VDHVLARIRGVKMEDVKNANRKRQEKIISLTNGIEPEGLSRFAVHLLEPTSQMMLTGDVY